MPLALIIFADKSHYDHHGTLSTTPIIFTLSCFNTAARNRVEFWRPMAFIPNLSFGVKTVANQDSFGTAQCASVQDEHLCINAALSSLMNVMARGGIWTVLNGRNVIGKV